MLFNSFEFLIFFVVVTGLYFVLSRRSRWVLLFVASCYFYMALVPAYILILFFLIAVDYLAGMLIEDARGAKRKLYLVMSLVANISILGFFKYYNFANHNLAALAQAAGWDDWPLPMLRIILPIGLSFHTFQSMSYTIEVYRGRQRAERNLLVYALYVLFYPQMVAGPIERPQHLLHQFYERHEFDYHRVVAGLQLMLWGFFKKVVVADRLRIYVDKVYNHVDYHFAPAFVLATYFFAFEIYCDFSGYSDIARGAAKVMGFDLMVNFDRPYFAASISEFWKRWHISLSSWFRDYLYIPLGGSRVPRWRWYSNLMIVFLVSGLWHGANWNFVVWGALHGLYLTCSAATATMRDRVAAAFRLDRHPRVRRAIGVLITFHLVCLGWVYFRASNLAEANHVVRSIFSSDWSLSDLGFERDCIYGLWGILVLLCFEVYQGRVAVPELLRARPLYHRWAFYLFCVASLLLIGVFDGGQFIYFQF